MIFGVIMTDENDQPEISNDGEPTVMPTAFEIHDESYNPEPRPLVRRIR
jgi:hypothetical protein